MLKRSDPPLKACRLRCETVVQTADSVQSPGIPGMVLFNFASREKYIMTIRGNTMPTFASYLRTPKVKPPLYQTLRTETR